MSEIFTLSKKLITIKLENISHHPVYENLIPFYHKLNDYLKIYSEKFIHTYIKLNPPCVVKLNDNKFICIYNILSYFLANNFYSNDTKINCIEILDIYFKEEEKFILDLIIQDILKFFPLINKNLPNDDYYFLIESLLTGKIEIKKLSLKDIDSDKIYNSYEAIKENFKIRTYKELFKKVFPITENTLKNNALFWGLNESKSTSTKSKFIPLKFNYLFEINYKIIEIELIEFKKEIKLTAIYNNQEKIKKFTLMESYEKELLFEETFLIAPNMKILYLKSPKKHDRLYIFNLENSKFTFLNFSKKEIKSFDLLEENKFKFFGEDAFLEKKSEKEYIFEHGKETQKIPVVNYLVVPIMNEEFFNKLNKYFLNK